MKKVVWLLAFAMLVTMMAPAFAVPLFPDVPEQHWARDAVADLAAKGVLEGYPDGTFKGDRAATRWEMAVALQRMLAKIEAQQATFATRADLEALRALVNNLRDELDALGVRVRNLEDNVAAIDQRVTELERITFEGDFAARLVTIGMTNRGQAGSPWANLLGSSGAVAMPQEFLASPMWVAGQTGAIPLTAPYGAYDMASMRPLVNGLGFTARARLGVKVKVSQDVNAGVRFAAYTALGNQIIDAYWGVTAPYLSNPHTASGIGGPGGLLNQPWTRMTLDKFFVEHVPSGTKLTAGSIDATNFDSFVLSMVPNPGIDGRDRSEFEPVRKERKQLVSTWRYYEHEEDAYLPFYGIQLKGGTYFLSDMMWEVLFSKLPDTNPTFLQIGGSTIQPYVVGANLAWKVRDQWAVKLNFASVTECLNIPFGQVAGARQPMMNMFAVNGLPLSWWNNPTGSVAPFPIIDPIPPFGAGQPGYLGTQQQYMYGASFNYRFEPSRIRVALAGAGSHYRPSRVSNYNVNGWMGKVGVGWTNCPGNLDLDLEGIYVSPYYDPIQLQYPYVGDGLAGIPAWGAFPLFSYFGMGYQMHDSDLYPNNRSGVRFGGEYRWNDGDGRFNLRAGWLRQVRASENMPQGDLIGGFGGYNAGFIEMPVFNILAHNGIANLETPRGTVWNIGATLEHRFSPSPFTGRVSFDHHTYRRNSAFAANTVAAQINTVDLRNNVLKLRLGYAFNDRFALRGGVDWSNMRGYHVMYNPTTLAGVPVYNAGSTVVNLNQTVPHIGFDYEIAKNTQWAVDFRYYVTNDRLATNANSFGAYAGTATNPYSFNGLQFMTTFKVKF